MLLRPGAIVAGKYRLAKPLARGGVGTVWVAKHVQLGHDVAVKFLDARVALSPQVRTRFEREARAAATLRSPHIVQVFDYGVQGDAPYLAMELLTGETLHARLRRVKRLSLVDAYRIIAQIGKGLKRAHDVGFVHRDLKPANIYLARNDEEEDDLVKILDFGIAKETNAEVGESTKTGELVGSPHFMSPEQIRGEREVDGRSDLWALGVILFKAITGELPFPGEVLTAVITKIVVDPVPSVRQHLPDAPAELDAFFAKALARDRTQRFQNVRELVLAFGELAAQEAGVASAGGLSPIAVSGTFRPSAPSFGDISIPSLPPGSGSMPAAPLSGSMPGTPLPGSMPGGPLSGSMPGTPLPGSNPGTPQPASLGAALRPPPVPVIGTPGGPWSAPPPSSPPTLTAAGTAMPAAATQPPRRSLWLLGLGALVALGVGTAVGVMQLRGGDAAPAAPVTSLNTVAAATIADAPNTVTALNTATPSTTGSAAPAASADASPTEVVLPDPSAEPSSTAAAAPAGKAQRPAATPTTASAAGKPRPAAGKKPVDTID
jgi:serine/threonine protein kinase